MKKIIVLILAVICIFGLCSCDEKKVKDETVNLSRGEVNEHVYTNESIDITFTKTENMVYATDEELAAMMNIGLETLTDNKALFEQAKLSAITCFMAKDVTTGNNVVLVMENLKMSGSSNITTKQYFEAVKTQLKAQTSVQYTIGEMTTATLGTQTYDVLSLTAASNGVNLSQNMYIRKVGSYMVCATITSVDGTEMSTFEAMFS